jgi:hypothetical protein
MDLVDLQRVGVGVWRASVPRTSLSGGPAVKGLDREVAHEIVGLVARRLLRPPNTGVVRTSQ